MACSRNGTVCLQMHTYISESTYVYDCFDAYLVAGHFCLDSNVKAIAPDQCSAHGNAMNPE